MEILIIITLVACVVSVIISVITLLTQKRLAENIGVKSAYDIDTNSYKYRREQDNRRADRKTA